MKLSKYRKNSDLSISAVQLDLETEGFSYRKWGDEQYCKRGDWIINNNGNCYTIDDQSFSDTYKNVSPGQYIKSTPVWAEQAEKPGRVNTKEGTSNYSTGDYIVSNNPDGTDSYAVTRDKFESMYSLDE